MSQFVIDINLPTALTQEFVSLIPKQRSVVNSLMQQGKILSYALSSDSAKLWVVMLAKNEEEVLDNLSKFPLLSYMRFNIHELAFHQSVSLGMPSLSMN